MYTRKTSWIIGRAIRQKCIREPRVLRKTFFTGMICPGCWTIRRTSCRTIAITRRYFAALTTTLSANPAACRHGVDKGWITTSSRVSRPRKGRESREQWSIVGKSRGREMERIPGRVARMFWESSHTDTDADTRTRTTSQNISRTL